jgi:hypothetical protein
MNSFVGGSDGSTVNQFGFPGVNANAGLKTNEMLGHKRNTIDNIFLSNLLYTSNLRYMNDLLVQNYFRSFNMGSNGLLN